MKGWRIVLRGIWIWLVWSMKTLLARLRGNSTASIIPGWTHDGITHVYGPLGIKIRIENHLSELPNDKPIVLVGNHPATYMFWAVGHAFTTCLTGKHPKPAIALRHTFTPMGWALLALGGIPINRRNKSKAERAIARGIKDARDNTVVMIYPESHRAFEERIRENQARLAQSDPHKAERFAYTLSGHPSGVHMIRQCLAHATWIRMYVGSDRPHCTKAEDIEHLAGSTIHIHLSAIEPPPDSREGVKHWLDEQLLGPCNDWIRSFARAPASVAEATATTP